MGSIIGESIKDKVKDVISDDIKETVSECIQANMNIYYKVKVIVADPVTTSTWIWS